MLSFLLIIGSARYYDLNNNGKLDFQEFCHMVSDIRALRGVGTSAAEVIAEAENSAKVFEANQSEVLTMSDFLSGVGQLKFRGTSSLLRSPKSVIGVLNGSGDTSGSDVESPNVKRRRTHSPNFDPCQYLRESVSDDHFDEMSIGTISQMQDEDYEFATHVVKVKRSGQIIDVSTLWEMEGGACSASSSTVVSRDSSKFVFERMDSIRTFNSGSDANEMLRGLRYFERAIQSKDPKIRDKPTYSWGAVDMKTVAASIIDLCGQARAIFLQEPRLLKLKAPVYVLGKFLYVVPFLP